MKGRTTLLRHREGISLHVRTWLVNSALDSVERRMNCTDNNHATGLWISLLDASWYRVDSRLVTIDGLGMLLMFLSSLCFQLLWLVEDSAAVTLRYVLTRDRMTIFCVFQLVPFVVLPAVFLVISWLIHVHSWTSAHLQP